MSKAPILLCCATKWECLPLVNRWALREVNPFQYEGTIGTVDVSVLRTGVGPANVREALAGKAAPRLLVSTGFAGALQPAVASGDLVLDVFGLDSAIPQAAREIATTQRVAIHFGRIAHTQKVLWDPKQKIVFGQTERCCAVDMESSEIRLSAGRLGCPFLAARVILDALDDRLPAEMPGETTRELASFVWSNIADLPTLAKVGWLQRRAMARLAEFLKELLPRL